MRIQLGTLCATAVIGIVAAATFPARAFADDWPQYLGPSRNSVSPQKGILRSWPEKGPEVLWSATVGRGYGGPVIQGGKVYLLDRDDKVGDNLRCLDLATGKELWNFGYDAPGTAMFPGSRGVPVVEGGKVYSCGHNGDLYCIDTQLTSPFGTRTSGRILAARSSRCGPSRSAP
jgi:outer membrane protein assembly factor BamB